MADKDIKIGLFGRRKTGKSALLSVLGAEGQAPAEAGAVAEFNVKLKGIAAPVTLLAPAGLDDERALGVQSYQAKAILEKVDVALLLVDASTGWTDYERFLLTKIRFSGDLVVMVINAATQEEAADLLERTERLDVPAVVMDLSTKADPADLLKAIADEIKRIKKQPNLLEGLVSKGDKVWLVVPNSRASYIDSVGPLEIRLTDDVSRLGASVSVFRVQDLSRQWESASEKPDLVISDPTALGIVEQTVTPDTRLTTPGILVARQRGELESFVRGAQAIGNLKPGDRVLIAENCQLHVQPDDIGRVEVPNLLRKWVGGDLEFSSLAGKPLSEEDVSGFNLVVRCGSCMMDRQTAQARLKEIGAQKAPVTNYAFAQAYVHGILGRIVQPFVDAGELVSPEVDKSRTIPLAEHDEYSLPPCM